MEQVSDAVRSQLATSMVAMSTNAEWRRTAGVELLLRHNVDPSSLPDYEIEAAATAAVGNAAPWAVSDVVYLPTSDAVAARGRVERRVVLPPAGLLSLETPPPPATPDYDAFQVPVIPPPHPLLGSDVAPVASRVGPAYPLISSAEMVTSDASAAAMAAAASYSPPPPHDAAAAFGHHTLPPPVTAADLHADTVRAAPLANAAITAALARREAAAGAAALRADFHGVYAPVAISDSGAHSAVAALVPRPANPTLHPVSNADDIIRDQARNRTDPPRSSLGLPHTAGVDVDGPAVVEASPSHAWPAGLPPSASSVPRARADERGLTKESAMGVSWTGGSAAPLAGGAGELQRSTASPSSLSPSAPPAGGHAAQLLRFRVSNASVAGGAAGGRGAAATTAVGSVGVGPTSVMAAAHAQYVTVDGVPLIDESATGAAAHVAAVRRAEQQRNATARPATWQDEAVAAAAVEEAVAAAARERSAAFPHGEGGASGSGSSRLVVSSYPATPARGGGPSSSALVPSNVVSRPPMGATAHPLAPPFAVAEDHDDPYAAVRRGALRAARGADADDAGAFPDDPQIDDGSDAAWESGGMAAVEAIIARVAAVNLEVSAEYATAFEDEAAAAAAAAAGGALEVGDTRHDYGHGDYDADLLHDADMGDAYHHHDDWVDHQHPHRGDGDLSADTCTIRVAGVGAPFQQAVYPPILPHEFSSQTGAGARPLAIANDPAYIAASSASHRHAYPDSHDPAAWDSSAPPRSQTRPPPQGPLDEYLGIPPAVPIAPPSIPFPHLPTPPPPASAPPPPGIRRPRQPVGQALAGASATNGLLAQTSAAAAVARSNGHEPPVGVIAYGDAADPAAGVVVPACRSGRGRMTANGLYVDDGYAPGVVTASSLMRSSGADRAAGAGPASQQDPGGLRPMPTRDGGLVVDRGDAASALTALHGGILADIAAGVHSPASAVGFAMAGASGGGGTFSLRDHGGMAMTISAQRTAAAEAAAAAAEAALATSLKVNQRRRRGQSRHADGSDADRGASGEDDHAYSDGRSDDDSSSGGHRSGRRSRHVRLAGSAVDGWVSDRSDRSREARYRPHSRSRRSSRSSHSRRSSRSRDSRDVDRRRRRNKRTDGHNFRNPPIGGYQSPLQRKSKSSSHFTAALAALPAAKRDTAAALVLVDTPPATLILTDERATNPPPVRVPSAAAATPPDAVDMAGFGVLQIPSDVVAPAAVVAMDPRVSDSASDPSTVSSESDNDTDSADGDTAAAVDRSPSSSVAALVAARRREAKRSRGVEKAERQAATAPPKERRRSREGEIDAPVVGGERAGTYPSAAADLGPSKHHRRASVATKGRSSRRGSATSRPYSGRHRRRSTSRQPDRYGPVDPADDLGRRGVVPHHDGQLSPAALADDGATGATPTARTIDDAGTKGPTASLLAEPGGLNAADGAAPPAHAAAVSSALASRPSSRRYGGGGSAAPAAAGQRRDAVGDDEGDDDVEWEEWEEIEEIDDSDEDAGEEGGAYAGTPGSAVRAAAHGATGTAAAIGDRPPRDSGVRDDVMHQMLTNYIGTDALLRGGRPGSKGNSSRPLSPTDASMHGLRRGDDTGPSLPPLAGSRDGTLTAHARASGTASSAASGAARTGSRGRGGAAGVIPASAYGAQKGGAGATASAAGLPVVSSPYHTAAGAAHTAALVSPVSPSGPRSPRP